jgi:hypothetical protein
VQCACAPLASPSPCGFGEICVDVIEHVIKRRPVDQLQQGHVNSMAQVGRNQPCPCGSGKKYKQCCLPNDEATSLAARDQQRRDALPPPIRALRSFDQPAADDDGERLDQMSNGAVDLIHAGKFDEAERLCHSLLDEFPDLPDGHMRLGQLFRARGELQRAAEHLRLAAIVARAADQDSEMPASLEAEADALASQAP